MRLHSAEMTGTSPVMTALVIILALMRESGNPVGHDAAAGRETLRAIGAPADPQSRVAFWILAFLRMTSGRVSRLEVGCSGADK